MSNEINIRLASNRVNPSITISQRIPKIFTPGEKITKQNEFMRLDFQIICFSKRFAARMKQKTSAA